MPAVGAGQLRQLTTTDQVFVFATANINNNTEIDLTSDYVIGLPAGTYLHCMSASTFAANIPQFMNF